METAISEAAKAYGVECGTEKHAKQCEVAFDKVAEMHRMGSRITLLAPDAVQSHFAALTEYIGTELLVMSFQCPKASAEERKAANNKLSALMANFMVRARYDIGIHPLDNLERKKKPWWRFWQP
jgi:hypothetical protein